MDNILDCYFCNLSGTGARPSMHSHKDYKEGPSGSNGRLSGLSSCTVESIPQETLSKKLLEHYYLHFDASPSEQASLLSFCQDMLTFYKWCLGQL